jgi:hypothetical protein
MLDICRRDANDVDSLDIPYVSGLYENGVP